MYIYTLTIMPALTQCVYLIGLCDQMVNTLVYSFLWVSFYIVNNFI